MKSLSIRICNIGPFRDEYIDFNDLGGMFLITGKTGSGKTTIFDCMTYALYGKFPGNRSGIAKEMRSKFASSNEKAFVEFTFSIDSSVFRVSRSIATEKRAAQVFLYKKIDDDWKIYSESETGTTKINDIIEKQLIHLEFKEFNRIIMLPQGEFATFLKQNSNERSETLSKLFPVEKYALVIKKAKEKAELYKAKIEISEQRRLSFGDFNENSAREKIISLSNSILLLAEQIIDYGKSRDSVLAALHNVDNEITKSKKYKELSLRLSNLRAREDEILSTEKQLEKSEEATALIGTIEKVESIVQHLENAQSKCLSHQEELKLLEIKITKLEEGKGNIEAKQATISDYDVKINELQKQKEAVIAFRNTKKEAEKAKEALETAKKELEKLTKERDDSEKEVLSIATKWEIESKDKLETAIRLALSEKLAQTEKTLDNLKAKSATLEKCAALKNDISALRTQSEKISSQIENTQKAHDVTSALIAELEAQKKNAENNAIAYELSHLLRVGEPCPVCGSISHPAPARKSGDFSMDDEIQAQKINLENAVTLLAQFKNQKTKTDTLLQAKNDQGNDLLKELQISDFQDVECMKKNILAEIAEFESILEDLQSDSEIAEAFSAAIEKIQRNLSEAEKQCAEAQNVYDVKKSICEEKKIAAKGFENIDEISEQIATVSAKKRADNECIAEWTEQYSSAQKNLALTMGALESSKKEIEDCQKELDSAKKDCEEKIQESSFADEEEVKNTFIEKTEAVKLRKMIDDWKTGMSETRAALSENQCDKSLEELESEQRLLQVKEAEISSLKNKAQEMKNTQEVEKSTVENQMLEFSKLKIEHDKLVKEAEPYQMLAEDISGKGILGENGKMTKKTSLDTWVLALYFSEILDSANPKLESLSAGRYQFKIETDRASGNGKTGLDFVLEDAYTGQCRSPQTLSGGETFMASISLALALTEVVQNRSGGIKLESLFIDEGFGTLDEEALRKAIEVLRKIQENRVIGVISHVDEMSSEILSQIYVEKKRTGSHIYVNGVRCRPQ